MTLVGAVVDTLRRPTTTRPRNEAQVPLVGRAATLELLGGLGGTGVEQQLGAMGSVGTLFAIVTKIQTAVARVDWTLYRKAPSGKDEDREPVTSHAALDLWNGPNDYYTRFDFVEATAQHFRLVGETPWLVSRSPIMRSLPLELWPLRPDRVRPVKHPTKFQDGWIYISPDGEKIPLAMDEVVRIKSPHPLDPYRGMGAVQTILAELDASRLTAEWNRNFFKNSAQPGGVVEYDEELEDEEFRRVVARWREQHQGVSNAHRVAVIEKGRWRDRKYSMRDMQFVELRTATRDAVIEAFGLHKATLGITEDVNRAASVAAKALFAEDAVVPDLKRYKALLNTRLLPMWGDTARGLEWDYDDPVPPDAEAEDRERDSKAKAWAAMVREGADEDDVADWLGLPRIRIKVRDPEPSSGGGEPGESGGTRSASGRELHLVEMVQKIYLGVGTVLTWAEARKILVDNGANLDLNVPPPTPEPSAPPAGPPAARVRPHRPRAATDPPDDPDTVDGIDLSPVQAAWEAALATLLRTWTGTVVVEWIDALAEQVRAVLRGDGGRLADLTVDTAEAVTAVTDALADLADTAARHAAREAADQDIDLQPATPSHDQLEKQATVTVELLGRVYELSAAREALRLAGPDADPGEVADRVAEHLDQLTDAQPEQQLGAALTSAQNGARAATFRAGPVGALYASEQLDANTCPPCRAVHGRWIANTDELGPLHKLYPTAGYIDCEGRQRCRGTVVGVWRKGTEEGDTD